jgi:hypothetical protein
MARKRREPESANAVPPREEQPPNARHGWAPDVPDVRAKNSGHP